MQIGRPAEGGDGAAGHIGRQRLAVPAVHVLQLGHALGLYGAGQDHTRLVRVGSGLGQCRVDSLEVVAVDDERPRAEGLDTVCVAVEVPPQFGWPALAEPVDVDDGGEIAKLVAASLFQRLPDRALRGLAVPTQHPGVVVQPVEVAAGQAHADRVRQALAERSGGHVDPRQDRGGMALQAGAEAPVGIDQLGLVDHPDCSEHRVQQRGGVSLREDHVVVGR